MNKIGFGFLRLPLTNPEDNSSINWELLDELVAYFLNHGGYYFDTAYTYMDGISEIALREAVTKKYPRSKLWITDKLPSWKIKTPEDCRRIFEEQLERCGVSYFDTYMLHWLNDANYRKCEKFDEFGFLRQLKQEGKIRHIGFSYHDHAELLDRILTEHPEVEYVQIQLNYLDWESPAVQAGKCYETAVKHGKKVIVMEPVKGGTLASLSKEAENVLLGAHPDESVASWAIRFAQSKEQVEVVLSGMNAMDQMIDNMRPVEPLSEEETAALWKACGIIKNDVRIPCTGCRYCVSQCPNNIAIPDYFALYNERFYSKTEKWKFAPAYRQLAESHGKASDCVECRLCENSCPQKLPITDYLKMVAGEFE